MGSKVGTVLKEARGRSGLSVSEVSEQLDKLGLRGASKTIYGWENGTSEPSADTLIALCSIYGISDLLSAFGYKKPAAPLSDNLTKEQREYVEKYFELHLEGRERVHAIINYEFAKQQGERKTVTKITQPSNVIDFQKEALRLREPSLPVCAGTGNYLDDNIEWEDRLVLKNKYTYGADYIIRLQGDSMEPEFHDGDRLIVTDARGQSPIYGRVGIFVVNGNAFFRQPLGDKLHPYNPKYPDIVPLESDDVRYVGYVVGIIDDSWVVG